MQPMKHCLLDDLPVTEVLDDDPLQQRRRHPGIPDPLRVNDNDRTASANTQTWRLAALDSSRTEEQAFPLQQRWQEIVQITPPTIRRAEAADAHEDVA
jgi:hypothetical protein